MNILIQVPFTDAENYAKLWANEENEIDFRKEHYKASRCTVCFAATELEFYLSKTLIDAQIRISDLVENNPDLIIKLETQELCSDDCGFTIQPSSKEVLIRGVSRVGVLYGCYKFLETQGWRWYAPGRRGELSPCAKDSLDIPCEEIHIKPSMNLARGFEFEGLSKESVSLTMWMARNYLNLSSYRALTGSLGRKLGMIYKNGGHIFDEILEPNKVCDANETMWQLHSSWYGKSENGKPDKERPLGIQFCVSQPDLLNYLSEEILRRAMGSWYYADIIDIWGFDTWGRICCCPDCRKKGNGSDHMLYFLSYLRAFFDEALKDGRLDHNVRFAFIAYEGTCTLFPPKNGIPENIIHSGDIVVFAPINRDYSCDIAEESSAQNRYYFDTLKEWCGKGLSVITLEYFNVSRFEDLGLLFTDRIKNDLKSYYDIGVRGMTYMHLPMTNWAMRTLNHLIYSRLCFDVGCDASVIEKEYFDLWYPDANSVKIKKVYSIIEVAMKHISSWRSWNKGSVLSLLQAWDGLCPTIDLFKQKNNSNQKSFAAFENLDDAIFSAQKTLRHLEAASVLLNILYWKSESNAASKIDAKSMGFVNPIEAKAMLEKNSLHRLAEDRRFLKYNIDMMKAFYLFLSYYRVLLNDDKDSVDKLWEEIVYLIDRLNSYYIPLWFANPGPDIECLDALGRSQLYEVYLRCMKQRHMPRNCRALL